MNSYIGHEGLHASLAVSLCTTKLSGIIVLLQRSFLSTEKGCYP